MANEKYKLSEAYWEASGVYDIGQSDTQRNINSTVVTKLSGIESGAEVNQNAFSNVKVGSTTVAADSKTDTIELIAGSNVTLTPDATNDTVTIAATDTTYSAATASTDGLMSSSDYSKLANLNAGDVGFSSSTGYSADTVGKELRNKVISVTSSLTLPSGNSIRTYTIQGLTSNHALVHWGFSSSAENSPPVTLEWSTSNGVLTVYNRGSTTPTETFVPVFVLSRLGIN